FGPSSGDTASSYRTNAGHFPQPLWLPFDRIEPFLAESAHELLGVDRADTADHPGPEILFDAIERSWFRGLKNLALNCWPWVRSFPPPPDAVTPSQADITAAWPTPVISSRWPRALTRRTQNPFSSLGKVTRSTLPASTSRSDGSSSIFMNPATVGIPLASTER